MKKLLIFDYDNTLAKPVSVPSDEVLYEITRLLEKNYVAVMSGRTFEPLKRLFVDKISILNRDNLKNLFICPSYGNKIYNWSAERLNLVYEAEVMTQGDKQIVCEALRALEGTGRGEVKEKEGYIVIDCLGDDVSDEEKEVWNPKGTKRLAIKKGLDEMLQGRFETFVAGRASVDVIAKGGNKADNTVRLAKMLDVPLKDVVFTGDEFEVYGNDYPLLSLKDIHINIVKNPEETLELMHKV
ncbi:HAD-IIB family hydrolase [Candidatus Dojkabacteria bacterium]|nr:HAD-IIB family hydrolase [Candidatus Dojkabacteria bacterium]